MLNRILNAISEKGITEQQFLQDLSFNRSLLSDWKSGKSKSYLKHINKIAAYFDVSADYLLGNTDIKNKPAADEGNELSKLKAEALDMVKDMDDDMLSAMIAHAEYLKSLRKK